MPLWDLTASLWTASVWCALCVCLCGHVCVALCVLLSPCDCRAWVPRSTVLCVRLVCTAVCAGPPHGAHPLHHDDHGPIWRTVRVCKVSAHCGGKLAPALRARRTCVAMQRCERLLACVDLMLQYLAFGTGSGSLCALQGEGVVCSCRGARC